MFRHKGKYSKYKNKHKSAKSYMTNFTNNNIEVGKNYVKLPKEERVKASISQDMNTEDYTIKSNCFSKGIRKM